MLTFDQCLTQSDLLLFSSFISNKKSRTYGTSELSDLLKLLGSPVDRERIGGRLGADLEALA